MIQCDLCRAIFIAENILRLHKCIQTKNQPITKKVKNKELQALIVDLCKEN
jgi:hypothetical protein